MANNLLPLAVLSTGLRMMAIVVLTVPFKYTHTSTGMSDSWTVCAVLLNPIVATEREGGHIKPKSTRKIMQQHQNLSKHLCNIQ